jgi:hypothetical protein
MNKTPDSPDYDARLLSLALAETRRELAETKETLHKMAVALMACAAFSKAALADDDADIAKNPELAAERAAVDNAARNSLDALKRSITK